MRLFISLGESSVNELKFDQGPVYVGRQMGNQVFLPDKSVSRQHAVFYTTKDGDWMVEDLGSSNKTYLNSHPIHKSELKHNDVVRVADFLIRVSLEAEEDQNRRIEMEDTLAGEHPVSRELHTVERKMDALDAPPVKFAAKRIKNYHEAIDLLGKQKSIDALYKNLMDLLFRQFAAKHVWLALRKSTSGPMDIEGGRQITTEHLDRTDLALPASLAEATAGNKYLLIHQLPKQITVRGIRSVMIVPISAEQNVHGVIYLANSTEHPHYSLAELDYLILLSINTAYYIAKLRQ
ncbi:MAG: FHA domain-containing protein [Planctomycetales bacterium]|nr:FHA domain-containing protein [Planctomycetales bacterium]